MKSDKLTAAIVIIGNEILSGKTQDLNVQFIATELSNLGIVLKEVRIVLDVEDDIISAVNSLRAKYSYIFTTGGIGPTHDDITAKTIAKAFGEKYLLNEKAKAVLEKYLLTQQKSLQPSHINMAYMPESAEILLNYETAAPGFKIDNVFVMAGVPYIMKSIFQEAKKFLKTGKPIIYKSIEVHISESSIAKPFSDLQDKYSQIEMGSYPSKHGDSWRTNLVLRGDDLKLIEKAMIELEEVIKNVSK